MNANSFENDKLTFANDVISSIAIVIKEGKIYITRKFRVNVWR